MELPCYVDENVKYVRHEQSNVETYFFFDPQGHRLLRGILVGSGGGSGVCGLTAGGGTAQGAAAAAITEAEASAGLHSAGQVSQSRSPSGRARAHDAAKCSGNQKLAFCGGAGWRWVVVVVGVSGVC